MTSKVYIAVRVPAGPLRVFEAFTHRKKTQTKGGS